MKKWVIFALLVASANALAQKPVEKPAEKFVTVSIDSLQKQLANIKEEFDYWVKFITEQEKAIANARARQTFLSGAANGLQAVLVDTSFRKAKAK